MRDFWMKFFFSECQCVVGVFCVRIVFSLTAAVYIVSKYKFFLFNSFNFVSIFFCFFFLENCSKYFKSTKCWNRVRVILIKLENNVLIRPKIGIPILLCCIGISIVKRFFFLSFSSFYYSVSNLILRKCYDFISQKVLFRTISPKCINCKNLLCPSLCFGEFFWLLFNLTKKNHSFRKS